MSSDLTKPSYSTPKTAGVVLKIFIGTTVALNVIDRLCGSVRGQSDALPNLMALISIIGNIAGIVSMVMTLFVAIFSIAFTRTILRNLSSFNVVGLKTREWYIYGFLVPVLNLFLPVVVFQELWKASDPAILDVETWKESPASKAIYAWWACWLGSPLSGLAAHYGIINLSVYFPIVCLLEIVAATLAFVLIDQVSDRQGQKRALLEARKF